MKTLRRFTALLLALALLLSCAACGNKNTASTMSLTKTEGDVEVTDGDDKDVSVREDLRLYSGYQVRTRKESYAWIDLDSVKLAKLDQQSRVELEKEGKELELSLRSGSVFFNVTKPLEEDESMTIRTSTMAVGIRGTCGWVEYGEEICRVYILEGKVRCRADGAESVNVSAGEMAELKKGGEITVRPFALAEIPAFVEVEIEGDEGLQGQLEESFGPSAPGNEPGTEPGSSAQALPTRITHINSASRSVYTYGPWGVVSMERSSPEGGDPFYRETYEYDEQGQLVRYMSRDGAGELQRHEEYSYNDQGLLIQTDYFWPDGTLNYYTEYTYSPDGDIRTGVMSIGGTTTEDLTDRQPELDLIHGYPDVSPISDYKRAEAGVYEGVDTYENGLLVRRDHYYEGFLRTYIEHSYDEQGRRIESRFYTAGGEWRYTILYEYGGTEPSGTPEDAPSVDAGDWQSAYTAYLEAAAAANSSVPPNQMKNAYHLYDIDKDGAPELIVNSPSAGQSGYSFWVYTCRNGEIVSIPWSDGKEYYIFGDFYPTLSSVPDQNGVAVTVRPTDYQVWRIENGQVTVERTDSDGMPTIGPDLTRSLIGDTSLVRSYQ